MTLASTAARNGMGDFHPAPRAVRGALLLLAVLYGLAAGTGARAEATTASLENHGSMAVSWAFGHAGPHLQAPAPAWGVVNPTSAAPSTSAKDRTTGFAAIAQVHGRSSRTALARTASTTRSVPLALRRFQLLFPFHIFW
ncbi:MAG: hypothetical protein KIT10_03060 [Flavobacteriales bacterium]|nr:hypothetical protein [Flavobacteriales bacterium]